MKKFGHTGVEPVISEDQWPTITPQPYAKMLEVNGKSHYEDIHYVFEPTGGRGEEVLGTTKCPFDVFRSKVPTTTTTATTITTATATTTTTTAMLQQKGEIEIELWIKKFHIFFFFIFFE